MKRLLASLWRPGLLCRVYVEDILGIMEKKMETTKDYGDYIGITEGIYILGLHWDNGKENGNDYLGFRIQGSGFEFRIQGSGLGFRM